MRNAIQALQELATSNTAMTTRYPYPLPAHSNPNLPDKCNTVVLQRSSSHPPEMFCWESSEPMISFMSDKQTQTDDHFLEQFVLQNPRRVLLILGLDADAILSKKVSPSEVTIPANVVRNHCGNNVASKDWISQPMPAPAPPPSFWHQQQHRFSAGDIDDRLRAMNSLTATRSLKFQPFSS